MSTYGESPYNEEKNNLHDEIMYFLESHPISELVSIVAYAIECKENN